eukprot:766817-Pyramimonas_sp.AAC.1
MSQKGHDIISIRNGDLRDITEIASNSQNLQILMIVAHPEAEPNNPHGITAWKIPQLQHLERYPTSSSALTSSPTGMRIQIVATNHGLDDQ